MILPIYLYGSEKLRNENADADLQDKEGLAKLISDMKDTLKVTSVTFGADIKEEIAAQKKMISYYQDTLGCKDNQDLNYTTVITEGNFKDFKVGSQILLYPASREKEIIRSMSALPIPLPQYSFKTVIESSER